MTIQKIIGVCSCLFLLGVAIVQADENPPGSELQSIRSESLHGDADAQLLYGLAYLEGRDGLRPDTTKALHWLRRAARGGNAYAQYRLGEIYAAGRGVKKDPVEALKWWRKAAAAGNADAQYHVGKALFEGEGAARNPQRAVDWLVRAAHQDSRDAQYLLGKMYYEGYPVPYEKEDAMDWLQRAAAQAHSEAISLLTAIDGLVDVTTRVYQESAGVLKHRAEEGDPQAEYELGLRYETGAWDVFRDNDKALFWITRSANAGNRIAMKVLADIYRQGRLGLKADAAKARVWAQRAVASPPMARASEDQVGRAAKIR